MAKDSRFFLNFTYFLIITAFFGTKLFTINLGPIQLSIFRVLLVVATCFFFKNHKSISNRYGNRYYRFLTIWVLYSLIMIVSVIDFGNFLRYFIFLFSAFIVSYYASYYFTKVEQYVKVLRWFEIIAVVFAAIGIYELVTGDYHFVQENSAIFYEERSMMMSTLGIRIPMSVFGNPNDFGLFLLFSFYCSLALLYIKNNFLGKILSASLAILFAFLIVSTQSRAVFMSLLGGITLWLIFDFKTWRPQIKAVFVVVLLLLISSIIGWLMANEELYMALISADEESDDARINLIKYGFVVLGDTYLLGTNIGNVEAHMAHYAMYTNNVENIHNWWMEVLVSSGVIIFAFYIILYARQIFFYYKNYNKTRNYTINRISQAFLCFMITFVLGSITASSVFMTEWMWTVFAVIFAFPEVYKQKNQIS